MSSALEALQRIDRATHDLVEAVLAAPPQRLPQNVRIVRARLQEARQQMAEVRRRMADEYRAAEEQWRTPQGNAS